MITLPTNAEILREQVTDLWDIVHKIDKSREELLTKITDLHASRVGLLLMIEVLDKEIARLVVEEPQEVQLELDLEPA